MRIVRFRRSGRIFSRAGPYRPHSIPSILILFSATRIEILTPDFRGRMDRALDILKMEMRGAALACSFSTDGAKWNPVGGVLDARKLSTKVAGGFVGAYFALHAFAQAPATATFTWAQYKAI